MGRAGEEALINVYKQVWKLEQIPNDWQKSLIEPSFKEGELWHLWEDNTIKCSIEDSWEILRTKINVVENTDKTQSQKFYSEIYWRETTGMVGAPSQSGGDKTRPEYRKLKSIETER